MPVKGMHQSATNLQNLCTFDYFSLALYEMGNGHSGPLPKAPGNKVYMLAMTDYFSKWIEAESFSQVTEAQLEHFIAKSTPETLGPMAGSPKNKIIVENLRKKLEEIGGKWAEELPLVLWADRTTPKVATGQTPFSLVFGAEAVIPSEVRVPTHRYGCLTEERNQVEMVGDLVLRKVFQNTKNQRAGKFTYNWEGPYQVESIVGNGAYKLMIMEGQMVPDRGISST
ncbi:uncharacterized protein LOC141628152 [Silene latifolia]|uniref:uncharacterized protein LOC141628152 n=1 Tax=Silene latifolia TaxID=37657 RepID=UPI003D76D857